MPDLLIELFSEEIPARMQAKASDDLRKMMTDGLVEAGLTYGSAAAFATPRRLALHVEGLTARSADVREERRGPKVGAPDAAIEGFCRGAGVDRAALEQRDTGKGAFYFATIEKAGRDAAQIVAEVLDTTIRTFPWPKSMRWGAGSLRWVRPLHSILCILSDEAGASVVPLDVDGIVSGNTTEGHRFLAPARFSVTNFEDYEAKLKRARVILRPEERAETIWHDATNGAFAAGLEVIEDKGLLAEVAGLVEWPVVLMGAIDEAFLDLPAEVLKTSMKEHQKFFSVGKAGRITHFVTVANIEAADGGKAILAGNQKVLSARLSDAAFFWENDLRVAKAGMGDWLESLRSVTFERRLGSQADRIARIAALSRELAPVTGADPDQAEQAARIAKADLSSAMVYEFPELQGVMGRYYAAAAGLPEDVAAVAEEHWKPLGASDDVPTAPLSVTVALADKLDTLTGFWAIDEKPTGSKDPFALRRAALGVLRLILANNLRIPLFHLIGEQILQTSGVLLEANNAPPVLQGLVFGLDALAGDEWALKSDALKERLERSDTNDYFRRVSENLLAFLHDRLKVHLRDQGIRHDVIDACLAMPNSDDLWLLVRRAEALQTFLKTDDGTNLLQGFKRANNILTQAEEKDGVEYSYGADVKFAKDEAEKALFAALDAAEPVIAAAMQTEDFGAAMAALAQLRAPIDGFFEAVQVNADNQILRRNRLNLLSRIRSLCLSVADLSQLEG